MEVEPFPTLALPVSAWLQHEVVEASPSRPSAESDLIWMIDVDGSINYSEQDLSRVRIKALACLTLVVAVH